MTVVAVGARGLALKQIMSVFQQSLTSGTGVACREMLPAVEDAMVVSSVPTIMCLVGCSGDYGDATKCYGSRESRNRGLCDSWRG